MQPFFACITLGYRQVTFSPQARTVHAKTAWTFGCLFSGMNVGGIQGNENKSQKLNIIFSSKERKRAAVDFNTLFKFHLWNAAVKAV